MSRSELRNLSSYRTSTQIEPLLDPLLYPFIQCSGYLLVKKKQSCFIGRRTEWQNCLCALTKSQIYYYGTPNSHGEQCVWKKIPLDSLVEMEQRSRLQKTKERGYGGDNKMKPCAEIVLTTDLGEQYKIRCDRSDELFRWFTKITELMDSTGNEVQGPLVEIPESAAGFRNSGIGQGQRLTFNYHSRDPMMRNFESWTVRFRQGVRSRSNNNNNNKAAFVRGSVHNVLNGEQQDRIAPSQHRLRSPLPSESVFEPVIEDVVREELEKIATENSQPCSSGYTNSHRSQNQTDQTRLNRTISAQTNDNMRLENPIAARQVIRTWEPQVAALIEMWNNRD